MNAIRVLAAALVAAPLLLQSAPTRAASSYDACTGFITSLPATISTQGVWCLKQDLATAIASGHAINITTNNVTLDCNGYKLGGLLAGPGTAANGVHANGRSNLGVRDCNIRGFRVGVYLDGSSGGGHRIERNRIEGNTNTGVIVVGDGSLVRDNLVVDTGGTTLGDTLWIAGIGVSGRVDVIDNQVVGVDGGGSSSDQAIGIIVGAAAGSVIEHNRITSLVYPVGGLAIGIAMLSSGALDIRDNSIFNEQPGTSVYCASANQILHGNALLMGYPGGPCADGDDNYGLPAVPVPL